MGTTQFHRVLGSKMMSNDVVCTNAIFCELKFIFDLLSDQAPMLNTEAYGFDITDLNSCVKKYWVGQPCCPG